MRTGRLPKSARKSGRILMKRVQRNKKFTPRNSMFEGKSQAQTYYGNSAISKIQIQQRRKLAEAHAQEINAFIADKDCLITIR